MKNKSLKDLTKAFLCLFLFMAVSWSEVSAGKEVQSHSIEEMVVTGSAIPRQLSRVSQSMVVIGREEIESIPATSISDLLETVNGLDIRQRGASGIQADVSIRGSSFEETLILVDGFNVSDAQTGHHNMNLPVNLEDIERIEILKGPGARVYGHNAMSGVINIITRDPDTTSVAGGLELGQHEYYGINGNASGKIKGLSNRVSVSHRGSSGYLKSEETDFDTKTISYKGAIKGKNHAVKIGLGYTENDFGAYKFYSDAFPDQRENTDTLLAYGGGEFKLSRVDFSPKVFWRRNEDIFDIDISGNWFQNRHQTDSYGFQVHNRFESILGETAFGGEIIEENLKSSNLGDHDRRRYGLFFEHQIFPVEPVQLGMGASIMKYGEWGWEYWPGADVNIQLGSGINGFASVARSFRIPTYTELYYNTPANQGNSELVAEKAWTGEVGLRRFKNGLGIGISLFYRDAENVIDWSREPGGAVWKVRNIADMDTRGAETSLDIYPGVLFDRFHRVNFQIAYTRLDSDRDTGDFESKYVLDHLRDQLNGAISIAWADPLVQSIKVRYEKRMNGASHIVADSRFTCRWNLFEMFLDITNIFNETYIDNGFGPAPGRWIVGGVRFNRDL